MIELPPPLNTWNIQPPLSDDSFRWQRGVISEDGTWSPLLTPKGYSAFNETRRNILLKGCRKSSKTVSAANKVTRHLWENDGAVVGVFARTMKNGMGGAWNDLVNFVFPGWEFADFGFKVVERGTNASTKMPFVRIKNMHGGTSEVQLHSVSYEPDIEAQVMSLRFSAMWFSQAEQFMLVDTYRILLMQLRMEMFGIKRENHFAILDANPPDLADLHWLHDLFVKAKESDSKFFRPDYHEFFVDYEFGLDDNPLLDPRDKEELKNTYKSDPVKYDRFVLGRWVRNSVDGHFDQHFSPQRHIIGSIENPDKSKWEILTPHKNARVLILGADTGTFNHSISMMCSRVDARGEICFDIFDEVNSIGKQVSIKSFANQVWDRVEFWNEWMKSTYGLKDAPHWRYWCDPSMLSFNASSNGSDGKVFWDVSGEKMMMRGVVKGQYSVMRRIEMVQRLFFDNRLFISAHCLWNISWARFLKPGRAKNQPVAESSKQFKHSFDATSYAIGAEVPMEINQDDQPSVATGIITT